MTNISNIGHCPNCLETIPAKLAEEIRQGKTECYTTRFNQSSPSKAYSSLIDLGSVDASDFYEAWDRAVDDLAALFEDVNGIIKPEDCPSTKVTREIIS